MNIIVNGKTQTIGAAVTVAQLLDAMDLAGKRVAVEVNREIVPKSRHAEVALRDDDRIEIVAAIGGG